MTSPDDPAAQPPRKKLSPAAERALAEAAERRAASVRDAAIREKKFRWSQRTRTNSLWRLGKKGPDVGFLTIQVSAILCNFSDISVASALADCALIAANDWLIQAGL